MSGSKPPKPKMNPRAHAMIYLIAMIYMIYLIFKLAKGYMDGGPDAPSFALMAGGAVALGGGCLLLGILARRMLEMAANEKEDGGGKNADGNEDTEEKEDQRP